MQVDTNIDAVFKRFRNDVRSYPEDAARAIQVTLFKAGQDVRTKSIRLAPYKSGDLRRSISVKPQSLGGIKNFVVIGTNKPYARIQDLGGIIRPKSARNLTIPIGGTRGRVRDHPDGFFIRSKAGKLLYVKKIGKNQIKPLFVLKKQVTIKGKPYLSRAFREVTSSGKIAQYLEREFGRTFNKR